MSLNVVPVLGSQFYVYLSVVCILWFTKVYLVTDACKLVNYCDKILLNVLAVFKFSPQIDHQAICITNDCCVSIIL